MIPAMTPSILFPESFSSQLHQPYVAVEVTLDAAAIDHPAKDGIATVTELVIQHGFLATGGMGR
jgi:hypothetical protein